MTLDTSCTVFFAKAGAAAAAAAAAAEGLPKEAEVALQALLEPQGLSVELLTEVLRWRLEKPDCNRGAVLDGLYSRFAAKGGITRSSARGEGDRAGAEGAASGKEKGKDTAGTGSALLLPDGRGVGEGSAEENTAAAAVGVVAKAASSAMPVARLLVLRFKDEDDG